MMLNKMKKLENSYSMKQEIIFMRTVKDVGKELLVLLVLSSHGLL